MHKFYVSLDIHGWIYVQRTCWKTNTSITNVSIINTPYSVLFLYTLPNNPRREEYVPSILLVCRSLHKWSPLLLLWKYLEQLVCFLILHSQSSKFSSFFECHSNIALSLASFALISHFALSIYNKEWSPFFMWEIKIIRCHAKDIK